MPHPLHRRRHRSHHRSLDWLRLGIVAGMTVLGGLVLTSLLLRTAVGPVILLLLAGVAIALATIVIGSTGGRLAASVCNAVREAHGRYSLEKFAREHRPHEPS